MDPGILKKWKEKCKLSEYHSQTRIAIRSASKDTKVSLHVINGDQTDIDLEGGVTIKQRKEYRYLRVKITDDDSGHRICHSRKAIALLSALLCYRSITKESKMWIYNATVKIITTFGSEMWPLKEAIKKRLRATEMDFWSPVSGISKRKRITNEAVTAMMGITHSITDVIKNKQLILYGHIQRMQEPRNPKQVMNWQPRERRRPGIPRKSWRDGINRELRDRELEDDLCMDRQIDRKWGLKGAVERYMLCLYTNI
uniref:Uncharacterized protein n=1 Tax=Dendroctonus ponderosae TaxID=77166 RepID=A0AAR5PEF9_DENPD